MSKKIKKYTIDTSDLKDFIKGLDNKSFPTYVLSDGINVKSEITETEDEIITRYYIDVKF